MITLTEQEVTQLQNALLELPAKFSIQILQFLGQKIQQAQKENSVEEPKAPSKKLNKA